MGCGATKIDRTIEAQRVELARALNTLIGEELFTAADTLITPAHGSLRRDLLLLTVDSINFTLRETDAGYALELYSFWCHVCGWQFRHIVIESLAQLGDVIFTHFAAHEGRQVS